MHMQEMYTHGLRYVILLVATAPMFLHFCRPQTRICCQTASTNIHPVQRTCVGWQLGNRAGKQTLTGLLTSLTLPGYNAINTDQLKYVRHVLFSYISPFGKHHPSSVALSHKVEPHGSESHGSIRQRCKPKQRQLWPCRGGRRASAIKCKNIDFEMMIKACCFHLHRALGDP